MRRAEAMRQLEGHNASDVVTAERANELAEPFGATIEIEDMRPMDEVTPIYSGTDHMGISIAETTLRIARGVGVAVEKHPSTNDHGFIAREQYEHNIGQLRTTVGPPMEGDPHEVE